MAVSFLLMTLSKKRLKKTVKEILKYGSFIFIDSFVEETVKEILKVLYNAWFKSSPSVNFRLFIYAFPLCSNKQRYAATFFEDLRFSQRSFLYLHGRRLCQSRNQYEAGSEKSLKMEAACSSETSTNFKRTTRRYIPEDTSFSCISCFIGYCYQSVIVIN
jgi:hypothetical protein